MRKSLQKTPRSALSSALVRLRAGLLADAEPRHAPKRNGRANGAAGGPMARIPTSARVATSGAPTGADAARLRLMEGFLSRTDIADCAQYALQWLADTCEIDRSVCLVRPIGEPVMTTVAAHNLPFDAT